VTRRAGATFASIPRVLHQIWRSPPGAPPGVPARFDVYRESWRRHHPSWEFRLWSREEIDALVEERYPWFRDTFARFPRDIQRVDCGKYLILLTHGGVYADLDTECVRPLDPLLDEGGVIVGSTPDRAIGGAVLCSPPGHEFWPMLLDDLRSPPPWVRIARRTPGASAGYVLLSTGPGTLRRTVRRYLRHCRQASGAAGITVHDAKYFASRMWLERHEPFVEPDAYVRHHYSDSWLVSWEVKLLEHITLRRLAALTGVAAALAVIALLI
jgi:mannosyltransferase OCH1-like enzyme